MKKENSSNPKKNNNFLAAVVSLILSVALFAIDLYLLVHQPGNILGLVGTTVLILIWVYFFVRSVFQEMEQNKQEMTSYLEAMLKSEKAFFLLQRKVLDEMRQFGDDAKLPSEEIITAQKAIAKLTINKSKENRDILMNSNHQLLERFDDLEERMFSLKEETPDYIKSDNSEMESSIRDILAEQRQIVENMRKMESSIKDEVLKAVSSMNEIQSKMPVYVQEPVLQENYYEKDRTNEKTIDDLKDVQAVNEKTGMTEEIPADETIGTIEEISVGDGIGMTEEIPVSESIGMTEEIPVSENIGMTEEVPVSEDIGMTEEIPADENVKTAEEYPSIEDIIVDGDVSMEEASKAAEEEEIPDLDALLDSIGDLDKLLDSTVNLEPEVKSETKPEPVAEAKPEAKPEPAVQEKPAAKPEPVKEAKPIMPDLSNPNKMMTPDEIAALLANM